VQELSNQQQERESLSLKQIAQETLLFVYNKIVDCRKPNSFIFFVMWQMRDAAKRILCRHKDSAGTNLQSWDALTEENENLFLQEEDSSSHDPEKQYAEQELWIALNQALTRLADERLRKVVYWRYIDGLPDKEIAERLEITSGYVRRLRNTAMNKLKDDKKLRSFFSDNSL